VWHVALQGLPGSRVGYALRVQGKGGWDTGFRWEPTRLLLDPRAPLVWGRKAWAARDEEEGFVQDVSARARGCWRGRGRLQAWCKAVQQAMRAARLPSPPPPQKKHHTPNPAPTTAARAHATTTHRRAARGGARLTLTRPSLTGALTMTARATAWASWSSMR
jgi:hypothetical protein